MASSSPRPFVRRREHDQARSSRAQRAALRSCGSLPSEGTRTHLPARLLADLDHMALTGRRVIARSQRHRGIRCGQVQGLRYRRVRPSPTAQSRVPTSPSRRSALRPLKRPPRPSRPPRSRRPISLLTYDRYACRHPRISPTSESQPVIINSFTESYFTTAPP